MVSTSYYSWRKDVYSLENETWFQKENIAPVLLNVLRDDSLQASKSGLLPVKGIEEHPRTVKNVVYKSDSEAEDSVLDYSNDFAMNIVPHQNQSTPIHMNQNSKLQSFTPHTDDFSPPQSWEPPPRGFGPAPIMPPSLFSHIAPKPQKNIARSSIPCVWSYSSESTNGIAPHYTSNFFHQLREKKGIKQSRSHKKGRIIPTSHQSSLKYQSQSQKQTMKRNGKDADEELGRRHSLYDQFVLNKNQRLQELTQIRPTRRAQIKPQGRHDSTIQDQFIYIHHHLIYRSFARNSVGITWDGQCQS